MKGSLHPKFESVIFVPRKDYITCLGVECFSLKGGGLIMVGSVAKNKLGNSFNFTTRKDVVRSLDFY